MRDITNMTMEEIENSLRNEVDKIRCNKPEHLYTPLMQMVDEYFRKKDEETKKAKDAKKAQVGNIYDRGTIYD